MKKQTGIWIDRKKAILIHLTEGKEDLVEIESDIENRIYHHKEGDKGSFWGSRHMVNEKSFDERKKHQTTNYLNAIREELIESDEIYIFGPAETKNQLKKTIETDRRFTTQLITVEAMDKVTKNQLIAKVKDYFKD